MLKDYNLKNWKTCNLYVKNYGEWGLGIGTKDNFCFQGIDKIGFWGKIITVRDGAEGLQYTLKELGNLYNTVLMVVILYRHLIKILSC
jgi:hypothetical protein